jgi:hypothetical protein
VTVSGIVGSDMELITSTNGTSATAHLHNPGNIFMTAPTRRPPALLPTIASWSADVYLMFTRCLAHAAKSVKVFFFCKYLPRHTDNHEGGDQRVLILYQNLHLHTRPSPSLPHLCIINILTGVYIIDRSF